MILTLLQNNRALPILFALLLIIFSVHLNWPIFSSHPHSIHAWAQADYYAIAQRFYLDTWNLFEPQSWVMNKQFPYNFETISNDTLTAGNIAIHPFIVGMLMRLLGSDAPIIYRVYCVLWLIPFFLGIVQIGKTLASDRLVQLMIVIMVGLSPVLIYYSINFLNVIPCLGQTMIGLAFYFSYLKSNERKSWWWAIAILGITPLIRTTYVIPLIAVLCTEGLRWLTKQMNFKGYLKQVGGVSIFLGLLAIWFFWNNKMVEKHDTLFITQLTLASSWAQIKDTFLMVYERWKGHYFNEIFVYVYLVIVTLGLILNRKKLLSNEMAFTVILLIGYILFFMAMIRQFEDHDYYFLDTFLLPLLLLPLVIWKDYQFIGKYTILTFIISIFFFTKVRENAASYHIWRYNLEFMDPERHHYEVYAGIDQYLTDNGISHSEPIFVMTKKSNNLTLMHIRRNGVIAKWVPEKLFRQAKERKINYFLISKAEVGEEFYPLLKDLKVIDNYGEVLLMTYNEDSEPWSLESFQTY